MSIPGIRVMSTTRPFEDPINFDLLSNDPIDVHCDPEGKAHHYFNRSSLEKCTICPLDNRPIDPNKFTAAPDMKTLSEAYGKRFTDDRTFKIMKDPVRLPCNGNHHCCDKESITQWVQGKLNESAKPICPIDGKSILDPLKFIPAPELKSAITDWTNTNSIDIDMVNNAIQIEPATCPPDLPPIKPGADKPDLTSVDPDTDTPDLPPIKPGADKPDLSSVEPDTDNPDLPPPPPPSTSIFTSISDWCKGVWHWIVSWFSLFDQVS